MKTEQLATRFLQLSVINGFLAIIFTIPILIPTLCIATPPGPPFNCKATMDIQWPGEWVTVAWTTWIAIGVFGTLFWGANYFFAAKLSNKTAASKTLGMLHLTVWELGVLGATGMMAAIGFVGGSFLANGGGAAVASAAIAHNIIPPLSTDPANPLSDMPPVVEAVFIAVTLLASLIGFFSLFKLKPEK